MSQEELSGLVFSFDNETCQGNVFSDNDYEYNFIREAIKTAPNMTGINYSRLPSYQLFQIKKGSKKSTAGM